VHTTKTVTPTANTNVSNLGGSPPINRTAYGQTATAPTTERATLIVRRYAEPCSFGGGFEGDCRSSADLSDKASYRVQAKLTVNFKLGTANVTADQGITRAAKKFSIAKPLELLERLSGGNPRPGLNQREITAEILSVQRVGQNLSVTFKFAGSNPLVPGAADIDTVVHATFSQYGSTVSVAGTAGGDAFPNAEFILESQRGDRVLAGNFRAMGSPWLKLPGSGSLSSPFATFAASVR
jgi:hypothetical protein